MSIGILNPGDIVSSGILTTSVGGSSGIEAHRDGVYGLDFGRGPTGCVPWKQIAKIEVESDHAKFILKNGMVAIVEHPDDRDDYGRYTYAEYYLRFQTALLTWARNSNPLARLSDGRIVYNLDIPPININCKTIQDAKWMESAKIVPLDDSGRMVKPSVTKSIGTHSELAEEIKKYQQAKMHKSKGHSNHVRNMPVKLDTQTTIKPLFRSKTVPNYMTNRANKPSIALTPTGTPKNSYKPKEPVRNARPAPILN